MIQFKLNGKKIQIATSWDEFTYAQFYETFNLKPGLLELVRLCNRTNYEIPNGASLTGDIEALVSALNFIKTPAKWDKPVLQCGPYKLPINHKGQFNIQFESLEQFEDMRNLLSGLTETDQLKRVKQITETYPSMVAIYLQKVRDGVYDPNKALEMLPEVKQMPAREVVTLGSFFLVKLLSLLNGTETTSPSTDPNPKKSKPVSKSSVKSSGRSPRSRKSR
jgi:hypothetical protein